MSTIAEIEAAIELLPPAQIDELAIWLEGYRARCSERAPADEWLAKARGGALPGVTTAGVMALTRDAE